MGGQRTPLVAQPRACKANDAAVAAEGLVVARSAQPKRSCGARRRIPTRARVQSATRSAARPNEVFFCGVARVYTRYHARSATRGGASSCFVTNFPPKLYPLTARVPIPGPGGEPEIPSKHPPRPSVLVGGVATAQSALGWYRPSVGVPETLDGRPSGVLV